MNQPNAPCPGTTDAHKPLTGRARGEMQCRPSPPAAGSGEPLALRRLAWNWHPRRQPSQPTRPRPGSVDRLCLAAWAGLGHAAGLTRAGGRGRPNAGPARHSPGLHLAALLSLELVLVSLPDPARPAASPREAGNGSKMATFCRWPSSLADH
jgi:hypothetical protein